MIISRNIRVLEHIVEHYAELANDEVFKTTKIDGSMTEKVVEQDNWIYEATAVHLAAKFMPRGLALLLRSFGNKELLEIRNKHQHTPLHIAARNDDSLSTRYSFIYI